VSDLAFIAGFHGLASLRVGEIQQFRPDGQGVVLKDGSKIDCDIVIKATGFHLNDEVPQISGYQQIYSFNLLDFNMQYGAEPLLDGAQFGSAKGRLAEEEDVDERALYEGLEQVYKLGLPDVTQRNNPFGSSYAGPMFHTAYFFKWLVENEDLQKELMVAAGSATQSTVKMWASQIGTGHLNTVKKLLAGLGALKGEVTLSTAGGGRTLYGE
ncbi:unnamed protein product, partial [Polarella glacialis]